MAAVKIIGKTKKKDGVTAYWYWTTLGPRNIDLTDQTVDLPPGNYELNWDFRGKSGATLAFSINGPNGALTTVTDSIPAGEVDGWGQKPFKVSAVEAL
jgi:hypothetical protein